MKTYILSRDKEGNALVMVKKESSAKVRFCPVKQVIRHSPTGMEWGYGGSGPADCALSILADCLGLEQANRWYQDFKWKFLAGMPTEGGQITEEEIREFVKQKEAEYSATYSK